MSYNLSFVSGDEVKDSDKVFEKGDVSMSSTPKAYFF